MRDNMPYMRQRSLFMRSRAALRWKNVLSAQETVNSPLDSDPERNGRLQNHQNEDDGRKQVKKEENLMPLLVVFFEIFVCWGASERRL